MLWKPQCGLLINGRWLTRKVTVSVPKLSKCFRGRSIHTSSSGEACKTKCEILRPINAQGDNLLHQVARMGKKGLLQQIIDQANPFIVLQAMNLKNNMNERPIDLVSQSLQDQVNELDRESGTLSFRHLYDIKISGVRGTPDYDKKVRDFIRDVYSQKYTYKEHLIVYTQKYRFEGCLKISLLDYALFLDMDNKREENIVIALKDMRFSSEGEQNFKTLSMQEKIEVMLLAKSFEQCINAMLFSHKYPHYKDIQGRA